MKQIQCSKQNLLMNWWSKIISQCSKQNHIQSHNPLCPHSLYGTPITDSELHHRFSQRQWGSHGEGGGGLHSEQGRRVGATRFTRQAGVVRFLATGELSRSLSLSLSLSLKLAHSFCRGLKGSCGFVSIWFLNPFFFFDSGNAEINC